MVTTLWVLGIKPESSKRADSALKHQAISPAPSLVSLKDRMEHARPETAPKDPVTQLMGCQVSLHVSRCGGELTEVNYILSADFTHTLLRVLIKLAA